MFKDISEILKEFLKKLIDSRIFLLGVIFTCLFCILSVRLFDLQIVMGEEYQKNYMAKTEKNVKIASTRGNI